MNIYKLDNEELKKYAKEFNKTSFGMRAVVYRFLPTYISICCFVIGFIMFIYDMFVEEFFNGTRLLSMHIIICLVLAVISLLFSCIANLLYGKQLKDYVETKKQK